MITKCETCKKPRFWFQVKHREIKPNSFMPKVKSEKKMCNQCFKDLEKYFIKEGFHKVEEK